MDQILFAAILASEEGGHGARELFGMPTYMIGVIAGIAFLLMFIVTVSFSGRGLARASATAALDSDEQAALKEYQSKHSH